MKRFVLFSKPWNRLLYFSLPLLALLCAGEWYVRSLPNPSAFKHEFLCERGDSTEILILGSSHTYYGIHPESLGQRAFSAAQVSQTLQYDAWILRHYPLRRLRLVILPLSDFSLYEELEGGKEWYLASRYRLYMDCPIHSRWSVYGWECTAFPVFCEKLKSLWQEPRMRWSASGQGLEYTVRNRGEHWDNGKERAANNRYLDFSGAEKNMRHLREIANYCRQRGVRLLMVSTPLRESYRQHQDKRQLADLRVRLDSFLHQYPEIRYLDYRADSRFTEGDFYDADHLSLEGARKFSRILREEGVEPTKGK